MLVSGLLVCFECLTYSPNDITHEFCTGTRKIQVYIDKVQDKYTLSSCRQALSPSQRAEKTKRFITDTQQYLKPQLKTADIYKPTGSKPFVSSIKQQCHFLLKYINRWHQYSRTVHSSAFWPHPEQHMGEDSLLRKYSRQYGMYWMCVDNKSNVYKTKIQHFIT